MSDAYQQLAQQLSGDLHTGDLLRRLYATDASIYRELPAAVVYPKNKKDIQILVRFARDRKLSLLPRGAGTSLAGQCVGSGIVIDCSRYMNRVLEINSAEKWVRVEPGLVRDQLNEALRSYGLHFGVNTSTSNRATLGGMAGNNSCGTTSIVYGTTRDHILEMEVVLSDGSVAVFGADGETALSGEHPTVSDIVNRMSDLLTVDRRSDRIRAAYPHPDLHRRNTGYALDALLDSKSNTEPAAFDFCKLLCGSEGTLAFTTSLKIRVQDLPPPEVMLVCIHFADLRESLETVPLCLQHQLYACELMDKTILDCTRENRRQRENRFFLEGDPAAVLILEFRSDNSSDLHRQADELIGALLAANRGFAYPKVGGDKVSRVWELRKAGLGVLANLPQAGRAVACVEDTAVRPADLPDYIDGFARIMAEHGQRAVYYAHAGAGELHLRPILDLRTREGRAQLETITRQTAKLVRQFRGALSGEHGDGRVRAPFLSEVYDDWLLHLFRQVKKIWDPGNIFNPGKIVDPKPVTDDLRARPELPIPQVDTFFDFPGGVFHAADRCNGSGDCRKVDGLMCPSFQATHHEKDSTRARANALREYLQEPEKNPFDHPELKDVLDLCLSCKGCTSECPSNVNMTLLKSEFLQQYYQNHRRPWRDWLFAYYDRLMQLASVFPRLSNSLLQTGGLGRIAKRWLGIAPQRDFPVLDKQTLYRWFLERSNPRGDSGTKSVYLLADEFLNYSETGIGQKAVLLLEGLGYKVNMLPPLASGRTYFSKGFLQRGRKLAQRQVSRFRGLIGPDCPLVGLEPSAILSFREEYPALLRNAEARAAKRLADSCFTIDEFLANEAEAGRITSDRFSDRQARIRLHVHCHQRAIGDATAAARVLSLPNGYQVDVLQNTCCGMAGSFGFEAEHYEISRQIADISLASCKDSGDGWLLAASGVSCRQQINDFVGRRAYHPVELLYRVLQT